MKTRDLNYQLGMMVGEYIVITKLPTLSTDSLKTRTIIEVSPEETEIWNKMKKELEPFMFGKDEEAYHKLFYEGRKWYHALEEKYIPETLRLQVPRITPTNLDEFYNGLEEALWDCDLSHYKAVRENFFEQTEDWAWCSYIILTRHIENIPEKFA